MGDITIKEIEEMVTNLVNKTGYFWTIQAQVYGHNPTEVNYWFSGKRDDGSGCRIYSWDKVLEKYNKIMEAGITKEEILFRKFIRR